MRTSTVFPDTRFSARSLRIERLDATQAVTLVRNLSYTRYLQWS